MTNTFENRLRTVYGSGRLWEWEKAALDAQDQQLRLHKVLASMADSVRIERGFDERLVHEYVLTDVTAPPFGDWIGAMSNSAKLDWIHRQGHFYVAFWLKVSRVADCYSNHFNHWRPRGDTGYLDADFRMEADENWKRIVRRLESGLAQQGFQKAEPAIWQERVQFVMKPGYDEIPDDDPRWDDSEFEPPLVPASVGECLFGDS